MSNLQEFATSLINSNPPQLTNFKKSLNAFITSKQSLNLKDCKTDDEIINKFTSACDIEIQQLLEKHLYNNQNLKLLNKSTETSNHFRSRGNEFYKQKRLKEALRCYTLAAAFAPTGSDSISLAYSNRSAIFSTLNSPSNALKDIESFESTYKSKTDEIAKKLAERKQKCIEKLNQQEQQQVSKEITFSNDYFKLKTRNDAIPSANSCVGIRNDEKRGRHVVNASGQVIPAGNLIILEPPFQKILLKAYSFEYAHCTTCLKDLNGGGIPCDNCVFPLYCSKTCKRTSPHTKQECKISPYLYELSPTRTTHLSLQILLSIKENLLNPPTTPTPLTPYPSNTYDQIRNLIHHPEILSNTDLITYSTTSLILTSLLPHPKTSTLTLLLHHKNLPCNAHSIYKLNSPKSPTPTEITSSEYKEIGAGAYSLLSLINHSCDPNVVRISLPTGTTAVISIHNINPNQEILDNYGVHFATNPRNNRTPHLKSLYNFDCDCDPCVMNWPTIDELMRSNTEANDNALKSHKESESQLLNNNPVESFKLSCSSLCYFDSNLTKPCKFVCISQEYMKQALFLISRELFRNY